MNILLDRRALSADCMLHAARNFAMLPEAAKLAAAKLPALDITVSQRYWETVCAMHYVARDYADGKARDVRRLRRYLVRAHDATITPAGGVIFGDWHATAAQLESAAQYLSLTVCYFELRRVATKISPCMCW